MTPPLWQKVKSLFNKVKEEREKAGLKLNIKKKKTNIIESGSITSWQIDGETVTDFIFLDSKVTEMETADMKLKGACSLKEKL